MSGEKVVIRRALLGVSDKRGLAEFARALARHRVEIVSTGGSRATLESAGITVRAIEDFTGFPEILDGRVKTLHPKVHGGILARRSDGSHQRQMKEHALEAIDLVAVNFYPFEKIVANDGVTLNDAIENIDIGGPTLVRAAAKNFTDVAVVVDPADYSAIAEEMDASGGAVSAETRWRLARKAFARVTQYDSAISNWLSARAEPEGGA
ncbi:MAG: bifunctional phosphoribosylaminoimidazolecarboxamide formyltransferase/IMP cyclohydrolase, partial [Candidatus Binataceae bacterium]